MAKRFSSKVMADILQTFLKDNLDPHQHRGEFVEGCLQCEKCRLIRQIAHETHQPNIIKAIFGGSQRLGKKAYWTTTDGEKLLMDDTDMRVSGRARRGR